METEQLKLSNQICFPVYAASRLITREYQPYLDKLGITYPQYLVLLVLWETEPLTVNEISQKLILNTNTVTPLLKRMEAMGILTRQRSGSDERKVVVQLTEKGKALRLEAAAIPQQLVNGLATDELSVADLMKLKDTLNTMINLLLEKDKSL
jgi:DNA-binding MarR family transcriptional regulator